MEARLGLMGTGHAVGSTVVLNADIATNLGLSPNWFEARTGIVQRRHCGPGENVLTLACDAIRAACSDAAVALSELGAETVLIHTQNGVTAFTPPAGVAVAHALGLTRVRVLGIDGVCAEPLAAIEIAALLLAAGRCERVIVSAAADFTDVIRANDVNTAGLFGAGAGALVLSTAATTRVTINIKALEWQTHTEHAELGRIPIHNFRRHDNGVDVHAGYYDMDGQGLAGVALRVLPQVVGRVLGEAGWAREDVDLVVAHQPNAKLLQIGVRRLGLSHASTPMPVRELGNMGPASLLVNMSLRASAGDLADGTNLLLVAFGLGFSCGVAALHVDVVQPA